MNLLALIISSSAVALLILGLAVETLGFLLGAAPVMAAVAVMLLIVNRSRGHRIPR